MLEEMFCGEIEKRNYKVENIQLKYEHLEQKQSTSEHFHNLHACGIGKFGPVQCQLYHL